MCLQEQTHQVQLLLLKSPQIGVTEGLRLVVLFVMKRQMGTIFLGNEC